MTKIESKNSLSPLRHFTEHVVGVLGKLPRENDLDHESSRLSIRWLNSTPGIQPASIMTTPTAIDNQNRNSTIELKTGNQERVVFLLRRRTKSTRRKQLQCSAGRTAGEENQTRCQLLTAARRHRSLCSRTLGARTKETPRQRSVIKISQKTQAGVKQSPGDAKSESRLEP
jgi:hypothetical protein